MKSPYLSVIIPAKNEAGTIAKLFTQLDRVLRGLKKTYEIIFVDDGSTDATYKEMEKIYKRSRKIKVIKHRGNFGKATALQNGFNSAQGKVVITLDADLQDDPQEIPKFLAKLDKGYDLVSGWKKVRHDPLSKVIPSRIFNWTTSILTGVPLHDINCGFKAYKKEVVNSLNLYGELFRFIPIIAAKQNFRVGEIAVRHHPRKVGKTKFGIERNIKGLLDLITIIFLTGYLRRPGHFFGFLGLVSFTVGFVIGLYITYLRITTGSIQYRHPLLFLGMLLMIVGIQLITTGLLAELIVHFNQRSTDITSAIEKELS